MVITRPLATPTFRCLENRRITQDRGRRLGVNALVLPEQREDVQRALEVAFAQRSVNGTFAARQVGLDGPANSGDLTAWPTPYRLGAAEGLTVSHNGFLALRPDWVPVLVDIVLPLPPRQLRQFIADLGVKVEAAAALPNTREKPARDGIRHQSAGRTPTRDRALTKHQAIQKRERQTAGELSRDTGLCFGNTLRGPMEPRNVNRRFEVARRAAGLERLRLHDLRHAFATFLIHQGQELRTVMDLLGHSTIRLTADTYGHVLPVRAREAADGIDQIMGIEDA
jgi:hypothetical protein